MNIETTSTGRPPAFPSIPPHASEATVTFLFTDIEGSTELWERHPQAMQAALARHDAIVRQAIEGNGGHVFKALGDAFFAAFDSARGAVDAAIQGQRALLAETWSLDNPIKVRMAIHSGTAERRDGDWFGPPLNRVARMLDAGHGGQILLSQSAEWLVADRFPEGAALRDLGERTLKDLARPERIFQLVTEDLPAEFPPLLTLDARPHNLPISPTALVGREEEIAAVRGLFLRERARLVTLLGPGGTGKTRLALQVAAELIDAFQHGVFLVNFAPVQDAALVPAEILQALGEKPADELPPAEALRRFVRDRQILLVLDNFEQLAPAAPYVGGLLGEAPELALLVTSQAALHVRGEREFPVAPLPVPDADTAPDPARLLDYDAVSLFVDRARAALPSFDLTSENAAAVATITRQLDGLPLALELAAARVKMFPPEALAARLTRALDFLTTGARDLPARQRTLRGAIEWSYGLLSEDERALFHRQAVFDGGFTLEAAEAVCSAPGAELDVVEGLTSLLDKSLIRQTRTAGAEPRFERLRTIRAFAVEKLEASGEANLWRRRHAVYFAEFASGFNPTGAPAAEVRTRLDRLQQELENLRAAFSWAIANDEATLAVRLCNVLPALWFVRGSAEEGERWVDRVLGLGACLSDHDRMIALGQRGRLAQAQGDNSPRVVADFEETLALARELGDEANMARAMMSLGNIHSRLGEHERAEELFRDSLEVYRRVGESFGECGAHMNLGDLYLARGEIARAREHFERAVAVARRSGDPVSLAYSVSYLGDVAYEEGDMVEASARYEESLGVFREVGGGELSQAWLIADLGSVARETGRLVEARARFEEAMGTFCERVFRPGIAHGLISLASVDALEGNAERAARLLGASEALRKKATITRVGSEQVARRIVVEQGRAALSDEAFEALRAQGAELSLAEALALAGTVIQCDPA